MRIDFHCHTHLSRDALIDFESLVHRMDLRRIDMVAITDHNAVEGALEFRRRAPGQFLVGEEIKTTRGELLAFFLTELVPPGLSLQETIVRVQDQGGVVGASHPLDRWRREAMGRQALESIHEQLDFVEVFNARALSNSDNRLARQLAARWGLPGTAGSDAHAPWEVGRAYVEMPCFEGRDGFLDCLSQGQIGGKVSSPLVHLASTYAKWRRRLGVR
jgi:predicted metal-dependent phosphoesterase TrpH